jgi:hypothetical protein
MDEISSRLYLELNVHVDDGVGCLPALRPYGKGGVNCVGLFGRGEEERVLSRYARPPEDDSPYAPRLRVTRSEPK